MEAARTLFAQGGESSVTLRRVAEIIEFSATTIYSYFPNKEALIRELCASEFALFARSLQQTEALADAMERLRAVATRYIDFGLRSPESYRVLFMREHASDAENRGGPIPKQGQPSLRAGSERPVSGGDVVQPYDHLHRAIFKAMAAGCFRPEYRDIALLSQSLWSCLHGVVALHLVRAQHTGVPWKPIQSISEMSIEAFFNGLTVPSCQAPATWRR